MDIRSSSRQAPRAKASDTPSRRRRNLIKLGLFGVGTFVVGKILGPSINFFGGGVELEGGKIIDFKNFRVVENADGELGFYDRLGNEILVMDHDTGSDSKK